MADEVNPQEKKEQPSLKPYTLEDIRRRKEEDEGRIKKLISTSPDIQMLADLPIRSEDIKKAQIRLARKLLARERTTERMKTKAGTDPLTRIPNRRAYEQQLAYELARSIRDRKPVTLINFDIDHFKNFNDTQGHELGDKVLAAIGKTLQEKEKMIENGRPFLRPIDTSARIGGEEFAIILPETNEESARYIAERIKQVVEQGTTMIPELVEKDMRITTSFGITVFEPHTKYNPKAKGEESLRQAIERVRKEADTAMYQAKNQGRDRIAIYLAGMQEKGK